MSTETFQEVGDFECLSFGICRLIMKRGWPIVDGTIDQSFGCAPVLTKNGIASNAVWTTDGRRITVSMGGGAMVVEQSREADPLYATRKAALKGSGGADEMKDGWIGVDLDGTLAEHYWPHDGPFDELRIGKPIPGMLERVKRWIAEGQEVRIFTARVGPQYPASIRTLPAIRWAIAKWCVDHLGRALPITATKDYEMVELWDDRAVRVVHNRGAIHGDELRGFVEDLLENDPNEITADGGITTLDVWRKEAEQYLAWLDGVPAP